MLTPPSSRGYVRCQTHPEVLGGASRIAARLTDGQPGTVRRGRSGARSLHSSDWPVATRTFNDYMTTTAKAGRYELLEELGRGAMGVVYRAHDPVIGRTVAVKTMRVAGHDSGLSQEELLRRFHIEARAAGLLSHPNIVAVYDAGNEDDLFYITMELVEGKSLQEVIGARHAFPLARVLRLMQQACSALEFAHQHNVIHRDIKPANLILTPGDTLKISDFGTAKILQFKTAQTGQIIGTPSYMSPEQIKGRPVDGRSDIFSLGGVLYELVTGEKPFSGESVTAVIYKIVSEEPAPPRELDSSIHPGLSAVILRALAKSPAARFQSCVEFFDALQNHREYQAGNASVAVPAPADRPASEAADSGAMAERSAPVFSQPPAKQGGSVWLALVLLTIIAGAGYKVWPLLRDLWLRSQPALVAAVPTEQPSQEAAPAAAAPAASVPLPSAPAAPVEALPSQASATPPAATAVPAVDQAPAPVPIPARASATPRRPARPSISPAAAEWREHIVRALGETGLGSRVQVVAAGNTLTLIGRLDTRAHRSLLELLQGSPAGVQIVDHIEYAEEPAENVAPSAPSSDSIPPQPEP